jgi:hypothetical protein
MSLVIKSNEDLLLEAQDTNTKLDTLNTNGAKEAKQDTAITALNSIVTNTDGLGLADTGTGSTVSQSATSVTIIAANVDRKQVIIRNDANQALYLQHGATATTASAVALEKGDIYIEDKYTGIISGIWSGAGAGAARVNEQDKA